MSRFATEKQTREVKTVNLQGAEAYAQSPRLALASLALTSVAIKSAYRSGSAELGEVIRLIGVLDKKNDAEFAAKTALYVRHTHGLRTISHIIAGEIAMLQGDYPWRRSFLEKVVRRPDDMSEIVAYVAGRSGRKMIPNALKKACAAVLAGCKEYALSKYNRDNRLVDLANLVHPKAGKDKNAPLNKLMTGRIASAMTWEHELSEAGKAENPQEAKAKVWSKMFREKQMGYMGCLMNLRNILEHAPKAVNAACEFLTDEYQVKNSLMLPTQFISAFSAVQNAVGVDPEKVQRVLNAINKAVEITMNNVPVFKGRTLIALDASNSMNEIGSFKFTPFQIGTLFAAVLYKNNPKAEFMYFADHGEYMTFDRDQKVLSLAAEIVRRRISGGTNFHEIFHTANKAYDRIVLMSDMQAWMTESAGSLARADKRTGENTSIPKRAALDYEKRFDIEPMIYAFDLKSFGTSQFPQRKVFSIAGWTDKVFDIMKLIESDKDALVHAIENVTTGNGPDVENDEEEQP